MIYKTIYITNKIVIRTFEEISNNSYYLTDTDTLIRTRRLACTIPLSMNCEGGDLEVFVGKKLTLNQRIGEAIVYPIWIYHRITPILSGKRISLVTWTIGDKI